MTAEEILKKHIDLFFSKNHYARFEDIPHSVFISAMEEYRAQFSKPSQEEIEAFAKEEYPAWSKDTELSFEQAFNVTCQIERSAFIRGFQKALSVSRAGAFTEGDMKGFAEWIDDKRYVFSDLTNKWKKKLFLKSGYAKERFTTSELLTQYLKDRK